MYRQLYPQAIVLLSIPRTVYTRCMKSKKPTKKDKALQQKIEKKVEAEKVKLDHPRGKERFDEVIQRVKKKKV